jgi:hypothetical protein
MFQKGESYEKGQNLAIWQIYYFPVNSADYIWFHYDPVQRHLHNHLFPQPSADYQENVRE